MSKGILKFANKNNGVDDVVYQDRELSTETGNTLSVYLNNNRVDLARNDLANVADAAVKAHVQQDLDTINNNISTNSGNIAALQNAIVTKQDMIVGLTRDNTQQLISVTDGTMTFDLEPFTWYNGTTVTNYAGEQGVVVPNTYIGKAVHIGLDNYGSAAVAETPYSLYCLVGSCFVNADGTMYQLDVITSPVFCDSTYFERSLPTQLAGFNASLGTLNGFNVITTSDYAVIKEGINYTSSVNPSLLQIQGAVSTPFKYIYPNYITQDEQINTVFIDNYYYNTTTNQLTAVPNGKYVLYRVCILENGDMFLLCQSSDGTDLANNLAELQNNATNIDFNTTNISNRMIYTDTYIYAESDVNSEVTDVGIYYMRGANNATVYNISATIKGVTSNPITTVSDFVTEFGDNPVAGDMWYYDYSMVFGKNGTSTSYYQLIKVLAVNNDNTLSTALINSVPSTAAFTNALDSSVALYSFNGDFANYKITNTGSGGSFIINGGFSAGNVFRCDDTNNNSIYMEKPRTLTRARIVDNAGNTMLLPNYNAGSWPNSNTYVYPTINMPPFNWNYQKIEALTIYYESGNPYVTSNNIVATICTIDWSNIAYSTIDVRFYQTGIGQSYLEISSRYGAFTREFIVKTDGVNSVTIGFSGTYYLNNVSTPINTVWVDGSNGVLSNSAQYHLVTCRYQHTPFGNEFLCNIEAEW